MRVPYYLSPEGNVVCGSKPVPGIYLGDWPVPQEITKDGEVYLVKVRQNYISAVYFSEAEANTAVKHLEDVTGWHGDQDWYIAPPPAQIP